MTTIGNQSGVMSTANAPAENRLATKADCSAAAVGTVRNKKAAMAAQPLGARQIRFMAYLPESRSSPSRFVFHCGPSRLSRDRNIAKSTASFAAGVAS